MFKVLPTLLCDGYKLGHRQMYPKGTTEVYSNLTPRNSRIEGIDEVVVFGIQYFVRKYLIDEFNNNFFNKPKEEVVKTYTRRVDNYMGKGVIPVDGIADLHDLGYLPLIIKALPEGSLCPIRVPFLSIRNTNPNFAWLPNYLETLISCSIWSEVTSATLAHQFRKVFDKYAEETSDMTEFVQFQGHDFSMRGMSSVESSGIAGVGHLLSFVGSDTVPAIDYAEYYYDADSDKELVSCSVCATEHAVACLLSTYFSEMV